MNEIQQCVLNLNEKTDQESRQILRHADAIFAKSVGAKIGRFDKSSPRSPYTMLKQQMAILGSQENQHVVKQCIFENVVYACVVATLDVGEGGGGGGRETASLIT